MRYGSRIKEWITDHDIKQKALAKEFHITESMMSHYMTGRNEITVDLLVKFAQKYGLSTITWWAIRQSQGLDLSPAERDLVLNFRTLTRDQRELIVRNVAIMKEQNEK